MPILLHTINSVVFVIYQISLKYVKILVLMLNYAYISVYIEDHFSYIELKLIYFL